MPLDGETVGGFLGAILTGFLTKLGLDKYQKRKRLETIENGGELSLNSQLSERETVLLYMQRQIDAAKSGLRNEFAPMIIALQNDAMNTKLRMDLFEKNSERDREEFKESVKEVHNHIDERHNRLEDKFDRFIERRRT